MVAMPERRLLIEKAIEGKTVKQKPRPHLGASVIGSECGRAVWYGFRWATERHITPKLHRLFNRGHAEELVVIEDLKNAGCKVSSIALDETIRSRFKTVYGVKLPKPKQDKKTFAYGHGAGSRDGLVCKLPDAPKTDHLLEVKTSNTKNFLIMKAKGVREANFAHYVQMNIYMHIFGLKRALYIMVCKENDDRHYERVKYNPKVARGYIHKAEVIITSDGPLLKISTDKDFYLCKWCDHSAVCHRGEPPARNCRTCKHIDIEDAGVMSCSKKKGKKLTYKKQIKACSKYKRNPLI